MALFNAKPLAYFRTEYKRFGGKKKIIRYIMVMDNGVLKVVDVTQLKTSSIRSFGGIPMKMFNSTRQEWEKALQIVMNNLSK